MPEDNVIPINYVKPRQGEQVCRWLASPEDLLAKLAQHLSVPADRVNRKNFIVKSTTIPGAEDQDKIWVKTSSPFGIGFFAGGVWQVAYSVPSGLIFPISWQTSTPQGFRELTPNEIGTIGLTPLQNGKWITAK